MKKTFKIFFLLILVFANSIFAQSKKNDDQKCEYKKLTDNSYYYKLENGLSLFIAENKAVPLCYIEIAVRAGGITQDKKTAGLFHLYEHMMFKGNKKFTNSALVQKALTDMGTGNWNGATGIECVNYFFTIPTAQLENGLDFWNNAIRYPLLDKEELEAEKKVVFSEIQGQVSNPDRIAGSYINNFLYEKPWQLDPSGSTENVMNATVEQLKEIQKTFYIPENAALFVGGDVEHEEVYELVKKIYGDWLNNGIELSQIKKSIEKQSKAPFEKTKYAVFPYEKIPPQMMMVSHYYRGPDFDYEPNDTYAMDLFTYYLKNPKSDFLNDFLSDSKLSILSENDIGLSYFTRRTTGIIELYSILNINNDDVLDKYLYYEKKQQKYFQQCLNSNQIISEENFAKVIQKLKDDKVYEAETFMGLLSSYKDAWVTTSIDYFLEYNKNIEKVTNNDIKDVITNYIYTKKPFVLICVHPDVYAKYKEKFVEYKFEEVSASNAFWHSNLLKNE